MSARHWLCSFRSRISAITRTFAVAAVMLAGVVLQTHLAWAGYGFQPVNPEELKMTSEPQAPGAPAIILYRQVYRDDDRYTPHEDNYLRVKILTEEGRKHADVEIVYLKGFQEIVNIHARTIKPDGTIVDFGGKVFDKTLEKRQGGDAYLAKTFTLQDVQVGSILEYYYTIDFKEYFIFDSHWTLSADLFTRNAKFLLKPYSGDTQYHLRWTWNSLPEGSKPAQGGAQNIVEMDARNIAAFQEEDFSPPENELRAHVDFIYDEELPEADPNKYWQRWGKKANGALESFIGKRGGMQEAVAQIVAPGDAPEVKLRKIYDRVQQIRNTSYELRKTEQEQKREKEKSPANVEDVWKWGYGDGKQLTWLYVALVRAAGFEAYGCWVGNRYSYFFESTTMQGRRLNSNVALVELNGKDLYLDPGAAFTPFGVLPWPETGVKGLRLDKEGGGWIQTTMPEASTSQSHREAKLELSGTGDVEGELTVTYTGLEAMHRRVHEQHEDETARKKYLEDSLKEQIPAAVELELTNQPDWKSSEAPLVAVFKLKIPGWASSAGKRAMLPVGFFSADEKHLFEHTSRVYPVYFAYPYEKLDEVTVKLPEGWQVASVPAPQVQDAKVIVYSLKVENNGGQVRVVRKLDLDLVILPSAQYGALRNFYQLVRNGDEEQVLLQPGAASARN
jgi:hypothetical protein